MPISTLTLTHTRNRRSAPPNNGAPRTCCVSRLSSRESNPDLVGEALHAPATAKTVYCLATHR